MIAEKLKAKSVTNWDKLNLARAIGYCVEWAGYVRKDGYGSVWVKGPRFPHRLAYELANQVTLQPKQVVMHECDNRRCINPHHLTLGTYAQNTATIDKRRFTGRKPVDRSAILASIRHLSMRDRAAVLGLSISHTQSLYQPKRIRKQRKKRSYVLQVQSE